jgi:hypothetical protein
VKPAIRNGLAVVAGLVVGSAVNMGLIAASGGVIPPPPGADLTTAEGLKASMHLLEPRHYVFPFLAHALGTLAGAAVAAGVAASRRVTMAMVVGVFFLAGGIAAVWMLPSPMWFNVLDLAAAYLPMAWIGGTLATRREHAAPAYA